MLSRLAADLQSIVVNIIIMWLTTVQIPLPLEQGLYHTVSYAPISTLNTGGLVGFLQLALYYWIKKPLD